MFYSRIPLLGLLLVLSSCGGGGGGSGSEPAFQIIDRSGLSAGVVTGFGSVFVNGVAYDTSSATITVDDQPAAETALEVGQYVIIDGIVDSNGTTGAANSITADPNLRGQIDSISANTNSFVVLGTQVVVNDDTLFDQSISPAELASLSVGDIVEVSGFIDAAGSVRASLITRSTDTELEARGIVANLDASTSSFQINNLTVDFSTAMLIGFSGDIANGDLVEAEGLSINASGALIAERVELEDDIEFTGSDVDTEVEIEGFITRFVNSTDFDLNGIPVTTDSNTEFEGGTAANLSLNARVEVEGQINANGILLADEIEFEFESNLRIEAPVEALDAVAGTLTVLGVGFVTSATTTFEDNSDADVRNFSLADLSVGDFVRVRAFSSAGSNVLTLVRRLNPEQELEIRGQISAIDAPNLNIQSAEIQTNAATDFELDGNNVDSATFFAQIQVGAELDAEGQSPSPGVLVAESVEAEN